MKPRLFHGFIFFFLIENAHISESDITNNRQKQNKNRKVNYSCRYLAARPNSNPLWNDEIHFMALRQMCSENEGAHDLYLWPTHDQNLISRQGENRLFWGSFLTFNFSRIICAFPIAVCFLFSSEEIVGKTARSREEEAVRFPRKGVWYNLNINLCFVIGYYKTNQLSYILIKLYICL